MNLGSLFGLGSMMTPPMFPQEAPVPSPTPEPKWLQGLGSPMGQIALSLLANSRRPDGRATPLGQAAGNSILGYQQQQRDLASEELRKKYMEAQIARMQAPDPARQPQSVAEYEYAKQNGYKGSFEDWTARGSGQPSQAGAIQEYNLAKQTGFTGSYLDFLKARAQSGTGPSPSFNPIQGSDGSWYSFDTRTGKASSTGVGSPAKPLPEAQVKQDIAIKNLGQAVDEYTKALPSLSALSYLNPAEHARIGTIYNNMMLQAKEAYNLGVLNGPDFEILQKVVTDPMTVKGAVTPNAALAKQASELKRIMGNMRSNIVNPTQKGDVPKGGANPQDPLGIR